MTDLLFVYGTLMRGYDHPMARLLSHNADFIDTAHCRGRLHLIKHYPGLVMSDNPADIVFGEVFRLRRPTELLKELDMYEACGDGFATPTEYVREIFRITRDADATVVEAWTYIYNWPVKALSHIGSGRFMSA